MYKKADLRLSIRAIVVLILAITMLGLGLAFIRGTFLKTTEQFSEVTGTVREQVFEEIKSKGEKLYIRGEPEIEIKRGQEKEVFFGILNVLDQDETFKFYTLCTKSLKGVEEIKITLATFSSTMVAPGDTDILPLKIKAANDAEIDTYSCEVAVTTIEDESAQVTVSPESTTFIFGTNEMAYTTKKFFIKVI